MKKKIIWSLVAALVISPIFTGPAMAAGGGGPQSANGGCGHGQATGNPHCGSTPKFPTTNLGGVQVSENTDRPTQFGDIVPDHHNTVLTPLQMPQMPQPQQQPTVKVPPPVAVIAPPQGLKSHKTPVAVPPLPAVQHLVSVQQNQPVPVPKQPVHTQPPQPPALLPPQPQGAGSQVVPQARPQPLANTQLQQPMLVPPQPQAPANQPVPQGTPTPLATAQLQQPMLVPPQPQAPANQAVPQGTPKPLATAQLQQPMLVPPQPQVPANQLVPQRTPNSSSTAQVPTTALAVPSGGISVVPDDAHSHALLVHAPDTPKPVTSGRVAVEGLYSLEYIEPGLQNRKVKVYRTRDAAEQIYKDTIPLDRGGFQLIVVGTRNPDYVH